MGHWRFEDWSAQACAYIRFRPDRPPVQRELVEHMEDHYEALISRGLEPNKAQEEVVRAMGDPGEVGRGLAACHRPWLGWLWVGTRYLTVGCLLVALFLLPGFSQRAGLGDGISPQEERFTQQKSEYGRRTFYTDQVEGWMTSDGYTFAVDRVAVWSYAWIDPDGTRNQFRSLYTTLKVWTLCPLLGEPDGVNAFFGVDDLGNEYVARAKNWRTGEPCLSENLQSRGIFTYTYDMWVDELNQEAQWLELRYQRSGRDLSLRIPLEQEGAA
jgi:hypothetical protein